MEKETNLLTGKKVFENAPFMETIHQFKYSKTYQPDCLTD